MAVRESNPVRRRPPERSSTTWVLMPPKPIAVTPARTGAPAGQASALRRIRSAAGGGFDRQVADQDRAD